MGLWYYHSLCVKYHRGCGIFLLLFGGRALLGLAVILRVKLGQEKQLNSRITTRKEVAEPPYYYPYIF